MLDAGLITAGPIADAGVSMRSAASSGPSPVGHGQGASVTQPDGSQGSFADVLQQSSEDSSNGDPRGQSSMNSVSTSNDSETTSPPAKAGDSDPVVTLPVIGGQLLAGPGAGMVGAPVVPVAGPAVLQPLIAGKDDAKSSVGSTLHGVPTSASAKNDMRKPTTSDGRKAEVQVNATPADVVPVPSPVNAPSIVTNTEDGSASAFTVPATKVAPSIVGDPSATPRPAGTVMKNVKDALSRPVSGDATGVVAAGSSVGAVAQDVVAAASAVHDNVSQSTAQHTPVAVDLVASAVGSVGTGTSNVVPVAHPMAHVQTMSTVAGSPPSTLAGTSSVDAALSGGGEHTTLIATPNVLEVGLSSGTHGWLRVRAEMSTGGDVSASVRAASETAYDALHKELPSISAYLASERVGVTSLVVEHPPAISGYNANPGGAGVSNGSGNGQGTQADSRNGGAAGSAWSAGGADGDSDVALSELNTPDFALPVAAYANASGGWLSVRA